MIAILAPYGRNEVTAAAIRLADFGVALGHDVNLVSAGVEEHHVHPLWDSKVKSGRRRGVYKAAAKADYVIHFQCHNTWYDCTSLVTERSSGRARHILVPNWHGLNGATGDFLQRYDQIICPSRACKRAVKDAVYGVDCVVDRERLTWVHWDAGIDSIRTEGAVSSGMLRACIVCDTGVIDFCGSLVTNLVDELLTMFPRLHITIASVKSWAKPERKAIAGLRTRWEKRFRAWQVFGFHELDLEIASSDWVVLPSVRSDFGLIATRALAYGKPVIANNVEPFSDVITPASGVLVPCDVRHGAFKSPIAVADYANWLDTCQKALCDNRTLCLLQTKEWRVEEYRAAFQSVWRRALSA